MCGPTGNEGTAHLVGTTVEQTSRTDDGVLLRVIIIIFLAAVRAVQPHSFQRSLELEVAGSIKRFGAMARATSSRAAALADDAAGGGGDGGGGAGGRGGGGSSSDLGTLRLEVVVTVCHDVS